MFQKVLHIAGVDTDFITPSWCYNRLYVFPWVRIQGCLCTQFTYSIDWIDVCLYVHMHVTTAHGQS